MMRGAEPPLRSARHGRRTGGVSPLGARRREPHSYEARGAHREGCPVEAYAETTN